MTIKAERIESESSTDVYKLFVPQSAEKMDGTKVEISVCETVDVKMLELQRMYFMATIERAQEDLEQVNKKLAAIEALEG